MCLNFRKAFTMTALLTHSNMHPSPSLCRGLTSFSVNNSLFGPRWESTMEEDKEKWSQVMTSPEASRSLWQSEMRDGESWRTLMVGQKSLFNVVGEKGAIEDWREVGRNVWWEFSLVNWIYIWKYILTHFRHWNDGHLGILLKTTHQGISHTSLLWSQ